MNENGICTILTEDGLCGWWVLCGECVGATCNDFPYTYVYYKGSEYVFPTAACESVVELLLSKTDPIQLISIPQNAVRVQYLCSINEEDFQKRPLLQCYPELIRWGLAILQDRQFSLDDRFALLSGAMGLIEKYEKSDLVKDLPEAMDSFLQWDNLHDILRQYGQYTFDGRALLAVNTGVLQQISGLPEYYDKAKLVLEGLGAELEEADDSRDKSCKVKIYDMDKYKQRKEVLSDFMRKKEAFLENIMVCEFLRGITPLAMPDVWGSFQNFSVCYAMHKGMILGSFNEAPDDYCLTDAIVLLHRMHIHNFSANRNTLQYLKDIQLMDLTSMVALAKG